MAEGVLQISERSVFIKQLSIHKETSLNLCVIELVHINHSLAKACMYVGGFFN